MPKPKKVKAVKPKAAASEAAADKVTSYGHPESKALLRPEIGAQTHFKKTKPPQKYRYDDSLSPALEWDGQNPARELGEWLLARIEEASRLPAPHQFPKAKQFGDIKVFGLSDAVQALRALEKPFLNWAGKAERLSFDVPTVPLFVHERLSTKAIIETLKGHKRDKQEDFMAGLFGDPRQDLADQVTKAYEYPDKWVNRLILGDSLVVMNSLLRFESLGGQVQMIYMDPPYGVKFGSNFQPFVRKRDVANNDDADMTREPEMVQAYRDTWELGLHSYLTYLRDRLLVARDLLTPSGSIFVQISDENLHHVREVMDEVFGKENFISQISFQTTSGFETNLLATLGDFLLWYARDRDRAKVRKVFYPKQSDLGELDGCWVLMADGTYRGVSAAEKRGEAQIPPDARLYRPSDLTSQGGPNEPQPFSFEGKIYSPPPGSHWKPNYPTGMQQLAASGRIHVARNSIRYRRFNDDFPFSEFGNIWTDTITGSFTADKVYVVQTNVKVVARCLLMTTDPGDLVLDPTCGSGTTAYVAEQWGRRWITCDTSRVPLALARQRLLTATFDYYKLKDEPRGPAGGFAYERRQNQKGEEVGGIVPHITLESVANNEPPQEEVLVDRPEVANKITRVCGALVVEATIPTAEALDEEPETPGIQSEQHTNHVERMLEVLRRSPVLRLPGNQKVTLKNIRVPAQTLTLSAEAVVDVPSPEDLAVEAGHEMKLHANGRPVAILFGPENGALTERFVREAWDEATLKKYKHL
jgi:adenine-specific DNA-methyltransferase